MKSAICPRCRLNFKTREDSPELFVLSPENGEAADVLSCRLKAGGGRATFVGLGRSMEPTLLAGDRLHIEAISGHIRVGWIVVFPWRGHVLTHRVVQVQGARFWARGDACSDMEGPVPVEDAIARVAAYWRDDRWRSLEGEHRAIFGLALNAFSSGLRRAARRWPSLRRAVEMGLLGSRAAKTLWSGGWAWVSRYWKQSKGVQEKKS